MLSSDPPGAEVFAPDGTLIGNTPVAVPRPASGEAPMVYTVRLRRHRDRIAPVGSTTAAELTVRLDRGRRPGHASSTSRDTGSDDTETGEATDAFDTLEPVPSDLIDPFAEDEDEAARRRRPR